MFDLVANANPDTLISGNWLIAIIGAIASGMALVIGKIQGRREGETSREVTLKKPVPTVRTQEEPQYVTLDDFNGHLRRIESSFSEIKDALDCERGIARTANSNIHKRIDSMSEKIGERLGKVEGTLAGVKDTTATLLDLALGKIKPGNNRSS
jgi:hypothetical protein